MTDPPDLFDVSVRGADDVSEMAGLVCKKSISICQRMKRFRASVEMSAALVSQSRVAVSVN